MATAEYSHSGESEAGRELVQWLKIVLWTVLFQIAWFWRDIPMVVGQGALPDTDDFQRLTQVRNWFAGQDWYDLTNYRMAPPQGADMHWSRLVDMPIAALIGFFDLFLDPVAAERAAALAWPLVLLVATVIVVIAVCRRLEPAVNPLVLVLFTVTCFTALTEFRPGRFDHHSIQILLFCLVLFSLVSSQRFWAGLLCGAAMIASLSIGLDAILLIVFTLAWIGISWALDRQNAARFMRNCGLSMMLAVPVFMAANLPVSRWLEPRCDALSSVYAAAFLMIGAAFFVLPAASRLVSANARRAAVSRLAAGGIGAAAIAMALYAMYPQCASGPYGTLSPELTTQWLENVSEARGLMAQLDTTPQMWIAVIGYGIVMLAVAMFVTYRRRGGRPEYLALLAVLVISFAASFLQFRALRIGIFASIPFCAIFVAMSWDFLKARYTESLPLAAAAQTAVVVLLLSPTWLGIAAAVLPDPAAMETAAHSDGKDWRNGSTYGFCNRESEYAVLAAQPAAHVMTDINSGAPALVFTGHTVVGGPYHRNGDAILATMKFFRNGSEAAHAEAMRRNVSYVAYCEPAEPLDEMEKPGESLAVLIRSGREPSWLQRLSNPDARMHVFRLVP